MTDNKMVPVLLRSSLPSLSSSLPVNKILVPINFRRFHLSSLVANLLSSSQSTTQSTEDTSTAAKQSYDFVVQPNEVLLRSSLEAHLAAHGLSTEDTLEIECLPTTQPPSYNASLPSEDWVSCVSLHPSKKGSFLVASYDGSVSLYGGKQAVQAKFSGHAAQSALACCWLQSSIDGQDRAASGGFDSTVKVWTTSSSTSEEEGEMTTTTKTEFILAGHSGHVSSIKPSSPSSSTSSKQRLITSSWDHSVAIWSLDATYSIPSTSTSSSSTAALSTKKRRKLANAQATDQAALTLAPAVRLRGHTAVVSSALFDRTADSGQAYSASWDHSVKVWDVETGSCSSSRVRLLTLTFLYPSMFLIPRVCVLQQTSDKVLISMDQLASANLLATGAMDRTLCLWDFRQDMTAISLTMTGHTAAVSAVSAHPTEPLSLVSGSHDGTVRVWDARSPKQSLFVIKPTTTSTSALASKTNGVEASSEKQKEVDRLKGANKILAVDWDGKVLVCGGEGKEVFVFEVSA